MATAAAHVPAGAPLLEVDALRAGYGGAPALWDVSLRLGGGELVCALGANGAGKTTLINCIAGLHRASAGRIAVAGHDLSRAPAHRFCGYGVALVPEGRRLFGRMSVRDNLVLGSYGPQARAERARSLDYVCSLFPVVAERLEREAGTLSGGQQQMVAIGRALMARPRLLLLDEPSLGLAPAIVHLLFEAIRAVNATGTAVLLSEQNVGMALDIADRALVLEEGRVIAEGEPALLRARPELRRAYLG
jgi:branched-chain amino acid transport system ATP-binding protein